MKLIAIHLMRFMLLVFAFEFLAQGFFQTYEGGKKDEACLTAKHNSCLAPIFLKEQKESENDAKESDSKSIFTQLIDFSIQNSYLVTSHNSNPVETSLRISKSRFAFFCSLLI